MLPVTSFPVSSQPIFNLENLEDYYSDVEAEDTEPVKLKLFENNNFHDKFSSWVKDTVEHSIETQVQNEEVHIELDLDLIPVITPQPDPEKTHAWYSRWFYKVLDFFCHHYTRISNKLKSFGLHAVIHFDGFMADFKQWRTNFDLSDYIPDGVVKFEGDAELVLFKVQGLGM